LYMGQHRDGDQLRFRRLVLIHQCFPEAAKKAYLGGNPDLSPTVVMQSLGAGGPGPRGVFRCIYVTN
jgi:hypothetical protein